jgi:formyltetrahydrofolate deformylase
MNPTATLLLHCADRKGLVFGIARFILEHGGNIVHADQHQDTSLRPQELRHFQHG